ncbi:MAG: hypothetical protein WAU39_16225 [Polyangiales bacterium]
MGCGGGETSSDTTIEWAGSVAVRSEEKPEQPGMHFGFRIAVSNSANSEIQWLTDGELDDYKPAFSPDGSKIAFWRALDYGNGFIGTWTSKICVMNADGSNFRELTGGDSLDSVPYWTRDGSNQIVFARRNNQGVFVYRVSSDSEPGDEELISDPAFWEAGYSSLKDGRILVRREFVPVRYFLLTPDVGGTPTYEEISHPFGERTYMHKMTISPSESKVAYMKVENITDSDILTQNIYANAVIAYADFDAANLRIENEVVITEYDDSTYDWYPSWSPDEKHILYTHSGVIRAYDLETGITEQISSHDELDYRYPTVVGQTK